MDTYWDRLWERGYDANMGDGAARAYWSDEERAAAYDDEVSANNWARGRRQMEALPCCTGARVLDIGAGPGSLAIPLSSAASHITAVEPSTAMNARTRRHMDALGITNISVVERAWEDVDVRRDLAPPYDVVVCSFSLGMRAIRAGLRAMHEMACGSVHLFWHIGYRFPERELEEAFSQLQVRPFIPFPKATIVYNILCDMGIYANVTVTSRTVEQAVPSLRSACDLYATKHHITCPSERQVLREVLAKALEVTRDGGYLLRTTWHSAHLWWEAGDADEKENR